MMNNHPPICPHCGNVDIGALVHGAVAAALDDHATKLERTHEKGLYSLDEAAKWMGISRDTLEKMVWTGQVRSIKVSALRRISSEELDRISVEGAEREAG